MPEIAYTPGVFMMSETLPTPATTSWRAGPSADVLGEIHREDVNLVAWQRRLPAGVSQELTDWARRFPASFDEVVPTSGHDLSAATSGMAAPLRDWLVADLATLLARFASLTQSSRARVSFGAVRNDDCRRFHVDYLRYRMISTYAGPGTEWLPDDAVHRAALEQPVDGRGDINQQIVRDKASVRHAAPGEVLVMKGALHGCRRGAVHRSPPITASGEVRVVLIASTVAAS